MWEVSLDTEQSKNVVNNIMSHTIKPELAQYFHAALFSTQKTRLLKAINIGSLKTWPGLTEGLIKKHLEKSINTKMGHLHIRRQGL